MIDTKKYKSLEELTTEAEVSAAVMDAHRKFMASQVTADWTHTQVAETERGLTLCKRSPVGAILAVAGAIPADEMRKLADKRGFEWDDHSIERVVPYYASDERGDRHGDVVEQSWEFDEYEFNPIMLFSHNWDSPPIGGLLDWKVDKKKSKDYDGDALTVNALFATAEQYPYADTVYRLVKSGFMRSGSVGFFPGKLLRVRDPAERRELGLGPEGFVFRQNKLIEWSPCSVPANPGAHAATLSRAKKAGLLKSDDVQTVRELFRLDVLAKPKASSAEWNRIDSVVRSMWKYLYPDVTIPDRGDLDEPVELAAENGPPAAPPREPRAPRGSTIESISQQLEILPEMSTKLTQLQADLADVRKLLEGDKEDTDNADDTNADDESADAGVVGRAAELLAARLRSSLCT